MSDTFYNSRPAVENPELERLYELVSTQPVSLADAIIWIQGDRFDRGPKVLSLYQNNVAKIIVVTGNNVLVGVGPRPGENDAPADELVTWLKDRGVPNQDIILDSESLNTAEQAKNVIQLAYQKGWKRIIIVSSLYHQPRVFLTFLQYRILDHDLVFINQPALELRWDERAGGRDKIRADLIKEEENKIAKYSTDVADPKIGVDYLLLQV